MASERLLALCSLQSVRHTAVGVKDGVILVDVTWSVTSGKGADRGVDGAVRFGLIVCGGVVLGAVVRHQAGFVEDKHRLFASREFALVCHDGHNGGSLYWCECLWLRCVHIVAGRVVGEGGLCGLSGGGQCRGRFKGGQCVRFLRLHMMRNIWVEVDCSPEAAGSVVRLG